MAAPRFQTGRVLCCLLVFQSLGVRSIFIPLPDTGLGWILLISLLPTQAGGRAGRQAEDKSFLYPEKGFSCSFFCQPWAFNGWQVLYKWWRSEGRRRRDGASLMVPCSYVQGPPSPSPLPGLVPLLVLNCPKRGNQRITEPLYFKISYCRYHIVLQLLAYLSISIAL